MKKILLSALALVAAMNVNAQVFQVNGSEKGLTSEVSPVAAGTAWGSIEGAIDISNPFATDHKVVDCKSNDFNKVIIDGNEIETKDGVQGNDNPKDADGTGVAVSLKEPTSGAVIQLDAKKDGWVYIVSKLSTNKQYIVFEEGSPMGYKIAMENATEDVINIEVKGEGEYNYLDPAKFEGGIPWVIRIFKNDDAAESAGNGLGVFYFKVAAGCKYYASASGSKISWSGIYFSEKEATKIELKGSNDSGDISKVIVGGSDEPAGEGLAMQLDAEAMGLTSDLSPVEAGKLWGENDALKASNAFATDHKAVDCKNNDFNKVIIDGTEILTAGGIQGNDNPKDADGTGVAVSLKEPTSGAVIQLDAKKDGWVYIVSKLSTNKQYIVFEEGSPMGYKIAMENATEDVINIEVKGEGEYNYLDPAKFEGGIPWVIRIFKNNNEAESAGNGLGVFYFKVAAGCKYYASASGSKISWSGIYFSETEAKSVKVEGEGISKTIVGAGTGINSVKSVVTDSAIYNLAGQKVNASYKGVVIKNGKKFFQK